MDFDICLVCHSHIDYSKLDAAYPHLTDSSDFFPPEGMSSLEQNIYWGNICLACARLAEGGAPEKPRPRTPPSLPVTGPASSAASPGSPAL